MVSSTAIRFRGADGVVRSYEVAGEQHVMRNGAYTDLVVGTLATPVDPSTGVLPFPVANLGSNASYLGRDLLVLGKVGKGGTTRYSGFETIPNEVAPFNNTSYAYFDFRIAAGAATDIYLEGGDSGSPTLMDEGGQLSLVGIHSSIWNRQTPQGWIIRSDDIFLPDYLQEMDAFMEGEGHHIRRRYTDPVDLRISLSPIDPFVAGYPGELGIAVQATGSGTAHNVTMTLQVTGASWVGGPGWICYQISPDTWSCRRASMSAGFTSNLSAYWASVPASSPVYAGAVGSADGVSQATAAIQVSTSGDPYDDWAAGLSDPSFDADLDSDGLSNLLEYAFGGNPYSAKDSPHPVLQMVTTGVQLDFPRRTDAAARRLEYIVEYSLDLRSWTTNPPSGASTSVYPFGASWPGFEQVQIRVDRGSKGYARVRVEWAD